MNPQTLWDQLLRASTSGDWDLMEERAIELLEWLDRGGAPPMVLDRLGLGADWHAALAKAGCLYALELTQSEWTTCEVSDPKGGSP